MNEEEKTFQCPVCVKGKYKENSLIQHLIDKHPDFPASKKIRNEYQFPCTCPLCSQKITTPVALMTHYSVNHPRDFQSLKLLLGFDFYNTESTFNSSETLDIIPNLDPTPVYILPDNQQFFETLNRLISKSPIMHSTLTTSDILVVCCAEGIILMDLKTKNLGAYFNKYINGKVPIIEFNTPKESQNLLSNYNISIPTNVKTDPFICQNYTQFVRAYGPPISSGEEKKIDISKSISKIDLRLALINIAVAFYYLKSLGFFPNSQTSKPASQTSNSTIIKCPCCDVTAAKIVQMYRHLFRQHPFPAMIMNQYKMADQPKGTFICEACHEQNIDNFDELIVHVYENHRKELLYKTLNYLRSHKEIPKQFPDLEKFIDSEYCKIK